MILFFIDNDRRCARMKMMIVTEVAQGNLN